MGIHYLWREHPPNDGTGFINPGSTLRLEAGCLVRFFCKPIPLRILEPALLGGSARFAGRDGRAAGADVR